jgi:aminoglycoside 6'-N-acetyltransferase
MIARYGMATNRKLLRKASLLDLNLVRAWDQQPHVIESDPNDDWDWEYELGHEPLWRQQLVAEIDGRPIGFVQIIDPALEESRYWGDCENNLRAIDVWIGEGSDLGKGYGTQIMNLALEKCFESKEVVGVIIDPLFDNIRARRFYEKLGFVFVERRPFGPDVCAVYRLNRSEWTRR